MGANKPKQTEVTGAQLAAEIDALLDQRKDLSKRKFGALVYGSWGGIDQLRRTEWPKPAMIERVRSLIAKPPAEVRKSRMGAPSTGRHYKQRHIPKPRRTTPTSGERKMAAVRRSQTKRALALIESGKPAKGQAMIVAKRIVEQEIAKQKRMADPIEQAKTKLRRIYTPVFDGSVIGKPGVFIVGKRTIAIEELLSMAEALS